MIPIEGQPILTAAQMRAAEEAAAPTSEAMYGLMERAGIEIADVVRRVAVGAEVLVLCGPGNNGGDGYVAARILREQGQRVCVAALAPPRTELARRAAARWGAPDHLYTAGDDPGREPNPWRGPEPAATRIVLDALFGTGAEWRDGQEHWFEDLRPLLEEADRWIAIDLPAGWSAEGSPTIRGAEPAAHLTLALGALKPAHVLPSAARVCGDVRLIPLGLDLSATTSRVIATPRPPAPGPDTHKYSRGMVAVIAGEMPGAAMLASMAAARAGAGYVTLHGGDGDLPAAIVRRPLSEEALADERIDAIVVGPGLGRGREARRWLDLAWSQSLKALIVDGDALHLVDRALLSRRRSGVVVLTPHAGESNALKRRLGIDFDAERSAIERPGAELAEIAGGAWIVLVDKGATTWITDRRRTVVAPRGNPWLSTAGTGDVLAGVVGAMAAAYGKRGGSYVDAAAAAVWLHQRAADRCGPAFIADDLAAALTPARAGL